MSDKYVKAKVTVAIEVYINMANYPEGLTLQEAVADEWAKSDDPHLSYTLLDLSENVFLVGVEETAEDKNETALLAERLSKEL